MAIDRGIPDWHQLTPSLQHLQWGDGLTRDEMINQSPELRVPVMMLLPPDFRFPDAGSVASYFEQTEQEGRLETAAFPPPKEPTQSTTGSTFPAHHYPPSVGSGYGSGNTGTSAQTGVGRWGTSDREPET